MAPKAKLTEAQKSGGKRGEPSEAPPKKEPTGATWRPWASAITELVAAETKRFAKKHPTLAVTKLVLDVDSSEGDIFLAIDTSEGTRWTPGTFTHAQFADLHEKKKLQPLLATLAKKGSDDFLVGATVALLCLEGDGHLESIELAEDFGVLLRDHGETEAKARARMRDIATRLASI